MKTKLTKFSNLSLVALAATLIALPVHAGLPEPDNVLFGTVVRDGTPVTADDYDVTVEVRRTPDGEVIASYVMGSNSRLGNLYSVRVKLESIPPVLDPEATQTNDRVYVVVTDFNGDISSTNVLVGQRGTIRQLDLGGASNNSTDDTDGDGLPDLWELARLGTLNNGPDSVGLNGQTALSNYLTGCNPNDPNDVFRLNIAPGIPGKSVSFFARQATGAGYENLDRFYALEYATNVSGAPWVSVPNRTNILGNNTTITYSTTENSAQVIYRGQVRLSRP